MLHIKETDFDLQPDQKVIKADHYAAFLEAKDIIDLAQKRAQERTDEANRVYEEEKKRGYEEGLERGRAESIEHMIDYVGRAVEGYAIFEQRVVDLVMSALGQIIGQMDDKELIVRVVKKVLEPAKNQKRVTIRISPNQVPAVESEVDSIKAKFGTIDFVDIVRDERLNPGDCIVETEVGVVDGRLDKQLESIKKSLEKFIK
jgi:type III secretion protein L